MAEVDDILDPAHDPDTGVENAGFAGINKPEVKDDPADDLKVSEDGNVAEHKGIKYVRQEALQNERRERQNLQSILSQLDPVMPEFQEFLNTREQRRTSARDEAAAKGPQDDQEYLTEVAAALGFYDETQKPDLRRAQAHLNITRRESERITRREVQPDRVYNQRQAAEANRARARGNKFVDGQAIAEEKYIEAALATLGDEHLADPNVANLVQVVAAGLEYLDQRKNGTVGRGRGRAGREPMHVERGTGRFDGDVGEMSDLDVAAARARGKSPEQWAKLSKQVNKNDRRGAILEDV